MKIAPPQFTVTVWKDVSGSAQGVEITFGTFPDSDAAERFIEKIKEPFIQTTVKSVHSPREISEFSTIEPIDYDYP
jgi:hypothetical protein